MPAVIRVVSKSNELIDFISRPVLLKGMRVHQHLTFASVLQLSCALTRRGIELASVTAFL